MRGTVDGGREDYGIDYGTDVLVTVPRIAMKHSILTANKEEHSRRGALRQYCKLGVYLYALVVSDSDCLWNWNACVLLILFHNCGAGN